MNITYAIGMHEIDIIAYDANYYELYFIHDKNLIAIENNITNAINTAHKYLDNYIKEFHEILEGNAPLVEYIDDDVITDY